MTSFVTMRFNYLYLMTDQAELPSLDSCDLDGLQFFMIEGYYFFNMK